MAVLLTFCVLLLLFKIPQPVECLKQAVFRRNMQKYLANHVIATKQAATELECGLHCVADGSCSSVNYKISGKGKGRCELNNETNGEMSDANEEFNPEFNHLSVNKVGKRQVLFFSSKTSYISVLEVSKKGVSE